MKQTPHNPKKLARKLAKPTKPQPPVKPSQVRSGFEFRVLKHLKETGLPFAYEPEKIKYVVPEKVHNYIPDFVVKTRSGHEIRIEAKGLFDAASRKKMVLVKEQHPELDIRLLFQRDNYLRKGSKTKYSVWAKKHEFIYHVSANGTVPEAWLDE